MRAATADLAVLVSQALPEEVDCFGVIDGIIVTDYAYALPVAAMLRERLMDVDRIRNSETGRVEKEALVYEYLTSAEFRNNARAVVEAFAHSKADIQKERTSFERMWSKREAQIDKGMRSLVAMWGKMQGYIGQLPDLHPLVALDGEADQPALPPGPEDGEGDKA